MKIFNNSLSKNNRNMTTLNELISYAVDAFKYLYKLLCLYNENIGELTIKKNEFPSEIDSDNEKSGDKLKIHDFDEFKQTSEIKDHQYKCRLN